MLRRQAHDSVAIVLLYINLQLLLLLLLLQIYKGKVLVFRVFRPKIKEKSTMDTHQHNERKENLNQEEKLSKSA